MKTNESKFQECRAALRQLLRKCVQRHPRGNDVQPSAVSEEPPAPCLIPLDRITEHLRCLGLGQQVRVRFEAAGGDFILEDMDGFIHAKGYDEAVVLIERIWLYQP